MMNLRSPHVKKNLQDLQTLRDRISEAFALSMKLAEGTDETKEEESSNEPTELELAETFANLLKEVDSVEEAASDLKKQINDDPLPWIDTSNDEIKQLFHSYVEDARNRHVPEEEMMCIANRKKQLAKSTDASASSGDIMFTEEARTYKDPVSQQPIVIPVRSAVCNHFYDKESILQYLQMQQNPRCPVAGCRNILKPSQLVEDPVLKAEIEQSRQEDAE